MNVKQKQEKIKITDSSDFNQQNNILEKKYLTVKETAKIIGAPVQAVRL